MNARVCWLDLCRALVALVIFDQMQNGVLNDNMDDESLTTILMFTFRPSDFANFGNSNWRPSSSRVCAQATRPPVLVRIVRVCRRRRGRASRHCVLSTDIKRVNICNSIHYVNPPNILYDILYTNTYYTYKIHKHFTNHLMICYTGIHGR